jgi:hypothetical protein
VFSWFFAISTTPIVGKTSGEELPETGGGRGAVGVCRDSVVVDRGYSIPIDRSFGAAIMDVVEVALEVGP